MIDMLKQNHAKELQEVMHAKKNVELDMLKKEETLLKLTQQVRFLEMQAAA